MKKKKAEYFLDKMKKIALKNKFNKKNKKICVLIYF